MNQAKIDVARSSRCEINNFDKVARSQPRNKVAHEVSVRGSRFEVNGIPDVHGISRDFANKEFNVLHWESPPPPKRRLPKKLSWNPIGSVFGRYRVISFYGKNKHGKPMWVCRCTCGHYEPRTTHAIANPLNVDDCCQRCRHLKDLQARYSWEGPGHRG